MLTHIDEKSRPRMVDVAGKGVTRRTASARAYVSLPKAVRGAITGTDIGSEKGPVFQTAILAGIMAVKRTGDLIPLCHPLPIDSCDIDITFAADQRVQIDCTVSVDGKTGVEMEALTGAAVAALTIYDMCKALSHDIVIQEVRLLRKRGGKHDVDV
ncbi:MAG TPA: cyclic pyranopterin monophosphate synthase MoaC [Trueperaceae bacterium]|nr:cyclic pyranopterin monophosphate synthase MoaC [Trueperaceae bacterium]